MDIVVHGKFGVEEGYKVSWGLQGAGATRIATKKVSSDSFLSYYYSSHTNPPIPYGSF